MGAEQEIIFNACPFTDAVFLYHPAGQRRKLRRLRLGHDLLCTLHLGRLELRFESRAVPVYVDLCWPLPGSRKPQFQGGGGEG